MSTPDLTYVPLQAADDEPARGVEAIYSEAFFDDERAPFEQLIEAFTRRSDGVRATLGAFELGGSVVGMGSALYYPEPNLGYLAYLAVRSDRRGQGLGSQVVHSLLGWAEQQARQALGTPPRLTFWEVRHPAAAPDPDERLICERRLRFYERLGASPIPITYVCPSIGPGLPDVVCLPMVYSYPPGRALNRAEAMDLAWQGVVLINGAAPESEYWADARRSIDDHWPQ